MRSTSPNFADWRDLPSIKIWEIAALMQGFDSRALADVAVRDPDYPTSSNGVAPDLSWEIKRLISEVITGGLKTAPAGAVAPNEKTEIARTSLVPWLRIKGYIDLADALDTSSLANELPAATSPVPINGTAVSWTPERKLAAQTMLNSERARGAKAFAANTAAAFGVSATRLRQVLRAKPDKKTAKKAASPWDQLS